MTPEQIKSALDALGWVKVGEMPDIYHTQYSADQLIEDYGETIRQCLQACLERGERDV